MVQCPQPRDVQSRLYRRRFQSPEASLKAYAEICELKTVLNVSDLKNSATKGYQNLRQLFDFLSGNVFVRPKSAHFCRKMLYFLNTEKHIFPLKVKLHFFNRKCIFTIELNIFITEKGIFPTGL